MADPFKELVRSLEARNKKNIGLSAMEIGSDLGTITSRGELQLDNFKHPISDYLVDERLTMNKEFFTSTNRTTVSGENHEHKVTTPKELKPLSPGDRVVVMLVNGGQEHVVIAKVVSV
ncbi:hypothetical protein GLV94_05350 [Virgibacillus halodenitrificans]|uniref:DUF2577 family protein n=1 Tax=Virgibacillus halodenitrificans TaxID=1482 RepID=UPI00136C6B9D|nr:DUF2577 family protein [Virgibacillus halodenitrificans]MYL45061.1 hypothetical protein [Virgibacillus halodenitrificans]